MRAVEDAKEDDEVELGRKVNLLKRLEQLRRKPGQYYGIKKKRKQ